MTRLAGERRMFTTAATAATDPPPPGERAEDELHGESATVALSGALRELAGTPRLKLSLLNVDVRRPGDGWVHFIFTFGKVDGVTIKVSSYWAKTLALKLNRVFNLPVETQR